MTDKQPPAAQPEKPDNAIALVSSDDADSLYATVQWLLNPLPGGSLLFERPDPRIVEFERDLAAALAERNAAFEMSRCECGTDEACANLARLNKERDEARADLAAAQKMCDAYADENQRISDERDEARAEEVALKATLTRIAEMRDRDGNAIEMHRDELRGIAKAAL